MTRFQLTRILGDGALKVLKHLGGAHFAAWLLAIALLVVLNTFIDQVSEWARHHLSGWVMNLTPAGFLVAVLAILYWLSRWARHSLQPRVEIDDDPLPVKALILFLSSPGDLPKYAQINGKLGRPELNAAFEPFGKALSWRMPIAAIAHHVHRLERLIVSCHSGTMAPSICLVISRD